MFREIKMNSAKTVKPGRCTAILFAGGLMLICLFGQELILADDALSVKRDSDKTVYTIGAGDEKNNTLDAQRDKEKNVYSISSSKEKRDEEARKEERSWDMLMNIGIWQDNNGQGRPPHDQSYQNKPTKGQPTQPASVK